MTNKLRARARELAECAAGQVLNDLPAHQRLVSLFESTILTSMCEALREEPDEAMIDATSQGRTTAREIFSAMAEARARGLE
jgi:hypothetical protein